MTTDNGIHPEANAILRQMLDIFGGADGCVGFVQFRNFLNGIATRADDGDEDAKQIMLVAKRFGKLVDIGSSLPPARATMKNNNKEEKWNSKQL